MIGFALEFLYYCVLKDNAKLIQNGNIIKKDYGNICWKIEKKYIRLHTYDFEKK